MIKKAFSEAEMDSQALEKQYANDKNLNTRINLHEKYSVNKQGFGNWIYSQYALGARMRILEIGCGNGSAWPEYILKLPQGIELTLSDFSSGMLDAARARIGECSGLIYRQIDIMDIPYEDASMDVVIANMMLYHVPDIDRALSEVRRVLKPGGVFYCATYGENGMMTWLNDVFSAQEIDVHMNTSFTLQNGAEMLIRHFDSVSRRDYPDAFEITDTDDLVDYVLSMTAMANLTRLPRETVYRILEGQKRDGVIRIPKEYGMFVSR